MDNKNKNFFKLNNKIHDIIEEEFKDCEEIEKQQILVDFCITNIATVASVLLSPDQIGEFLNETMESIKRHYEVCSRITVQLNSN